jgi:hypothetical protein
MSAGGITHEHKAFGIEAEVASACLDKPNGRRDI